MPRNCLSSQKMRSIRRRKRRTSASKGPASRAGSSPPGPYPGYLYRSCLPSYTSRVNTDSDPRQEQANLQSASLSPEPIAAPVGRWRVFAFAAAGVLLAMLFVGTRTARAAWQQIAQLLSLQGKPEPASANVLSEHEIEGLDRM